MTGFGVVTLVLVVTVVESVWQVSRTNRLTAFVFQQRVPTAEAGETLLEGLYHSVSELRGYMLYEDPAYERDRRQVWQKRILPSLALLNELSATWTNPENLRRLEELNESIATFRALQGEIARTANTVENQPAVHLNTTEGMPLTSRMIEKLTEMIEIEKDMPATSERKRLLAVMGDVRDTLGLCIADIRAFLISGEAEYRTDFEAHWQANETHFSTLGSMLSLLTPEQRAAFDEVREARGGFAPLPVRMFEIRDGDRWDIANHTWNTRVLPVFEGITTDLEEMSHNQRDLRDTDIAEVEGATQRLILVLWISLLLGLAVCVAVSYAITRALTRPIASLIETANTVTRGKLDIGAQEHAVDEIGKLGRAMEQLVANLRTNRDAITSFARGEIPSHIVLASEEDEVGAALTKLKASQENKEQVILAFSRGAVPEEIPQASDRDAVGSALMTLKTALEDKIAVVSRMAKGDLTLEVRKASEEDRLGDALIRTIADLEQLIQKVRTSAEEVGNNAERLSQASSGLTEGVESQSRSMSSFVTSLTEIAAQTQQSADNASEANRLADEVNSSADGGKAQMGRLLTGMEAIHEASGSITGILEVINGLAEQTNLLALNASIEAASAGEHGRGFGVVAGEIKNLAAQTTRATNEIEETIARLSDRITEGNTLARETADGLEGILAGIGEVSTLLSQIDVASKEQAGALEESNRAIENLNTVSSQNTDTTQQLTRSSTELASLAAELTGLLGAFDLEEDQALVAG